MIGETFVRCQQATFNLQHSVNPVECDFSSKSYGYAEEVSKNGICGTWTAPAALCRRTLAPSSSGMFKVLDGALVFLCRLARRKRPKIPPLACLLVHRTAIYAKLAGFEFANHFRLDASV